MTKWVAAILAWLVTAQPALANDRQKLLGTWKLISWEIEYQDGERRPEFGKNPIGYVIFTPEGRLMAILEGEGRKAPKNDRDILALFRSMVAYTGMFTIDGDKLVTKVDVAWNPRWRGTDQVRFFKVEGDRLYVTTTWGPRPPNFTRVGRGLLVWERSK